MKPMLTMSHEYVQKANQDLSNHWIENMMYPQQVSYW